MSPHALATDAPFVCILRMALATIARVPLEAVVVVAFAQHGESFAARSTARVPVLLPEATSAVACGGFSSNRWRRLSDSSRQLPGLIPLSLETVIETSSSNLTSGSAQSGKESAVLDEFAIAFADPAKVDSLLADAVSASCVAQNLPSSACPDRPSLALSLSPSSAPLASRSSGDGATNSSSSTLVLALAAALATVGALLLAIGIFGAVWALRRRERKWRQEVASGIQEERSSTVQADCSSSGGLAGPARKPIIIGRGQRPPSFGLSAHAPVLSVQDPQWAADVVEFENPMAIRREYQSPGKAAFAPHTIGGKA